MTTVEHGALDNIDLLEDTWADRVPHDHFDVLRVHSPVHWHDHPEHTGFWAVTRHADVRAVSRDHQTFSAELGSTFIQDHDEAALELIRMTLLNMDPPKHSRYRRLVSAGFTPRMISKLVEHIHERAVAILDGIEGRDDHRVRRGGRVRAAAAGHLRDDRRARRGPAPDLRLEQPDGGDAGPRLPDLGRGR